jgi:hypothetical protein
MKRRGNERSVLGAAMMLAATVVTTTARASDPTIADCNGANEASIRLRNEHKLRASREQALVCAAASCPDDIRRECERRSDQINASIPTIVFEVKDGAGGDVLGVSVTMDGALLVDRLEGSAISLDPGAHRFVFEAQGRKPVSRTLVLIEGEKGRRETVVMADSSPPPAEPTAGASPPPARSAERAPGAAAADGGPARDGAPLRTIGFAALGVGVVGVGVGAFFGLTAMSKNNAAHCDSGAVCDDPQARRDAKSAALLADISFAAGAVFAGTGLALVLVAPSNDRAKRDAARVEAAPSFGARAAGMTVTGRF